MATEVGVRRQIASLRKGSPDKHGYEGEGWNIHIEGACGEMAFAKAMNIYWDGSVNTYHHPDVGGWQVRTRSRDGYELLVRENDADDTPFVHVTGRCPVYVIHGWILGREAKQSRWLKTYGDRPPAYFVPVSSLQLLCENG